jgi:hypothetical protein
MDIGQEAGRGLKVFPGVLRVHANLNRSGMGGRFALPRRKVELAGGGAQHPFHEIDAGGFFGDTVLDLQARVHLEKIEFASGVVVDEFDSPGVLVTDRGGEPHGGITQARALRRGKAGGGRFFDDLLIAPLNGAVAFIADGHDIPAPVAENLHFDVPGVLHEFLEEHAGVAEIILRQPADCAESGDELRWLPDERHADPAAASGAFQHNRITNTCGLMEGMGFVVEQRGAGE